MHLKGLAVVYSVLCTRPEQQRPDPPLHRCALMRLLNYYRRYGGYCSECGFCHVAAALTVLFVLHVGALVVLRTAP